MADVRKLNKSHPAMDYRPGIGHHPEPVLLGWASLCHNLRQRYTVPTCAITSPTQSQQYLSGQPRSCQRIQRSQPPWPVLLRVNLDRNLADGGHIIRRQPLLFGAGDHQLQIPVPGP